MGRCEPLNQKAIENPEEQNWGGKWADAELDQTGPPKEQGRKNVAAKKTNIGLMSRFRKSDRDLVVAKLKKKDCAPKIGIIEDKEGLVKYPKKRKQQKTGSKI